MNKRRIGIICIVIILGVVSLIFVNNKLSNKETLLDEVKLKDEIKANNKSFAIMIQKEDKTGYDVYEENTWPTEGYTFNNELSGCIDNYGSIIENSIIYDEDTNIITVDTGVTSSCYIYFDKKWCDENQTLSDCLIENPSDGLDKNLIGTDTLYRFSGTTGNTGINNYICLGTTEKCASGSDNMYRIIGVEPDTGYVKVIKQLTYITELWSSNYEITWPESNAYNAIVTWYNSISFKDMIVSHKWNIGDVGEFNDTCIGTRTNILNCENDASITTYVGALSLIDYYMAYRGDQNWSNEYSNYNDIWIHLDNNGYANTNSSELTMTRYSSSRVWRVSGVDGAVDCADMSYPYYLRPTFYIKTVMYANGDGTSTNPFLVE